MERPAPRDLSTEELFRLYAPFVARFLYRLGVRGEGLDDLVQEVFLVVHRNGGYRAGPAKPTSYLATIAQNAALAHRRKERTQRFRHAEVDVEELFSKGKSPVQLLEASDSLRLLQAALDRLDTPLRTTLILVEIEGESCASVASAMGIPVGTVYFRLHRARKKFQAAMKVVEAGRLRLVPPPAPAGERLPAAAGERKDEGRRARVGMALSADLLWQKTAAHDLLRAGYENPPIAYETLAGLERHRQLATAGMPLPDWATTGASTSGAAIGLGAGGAAVGAAIAAAVWLSPGSHGAVAAADASPAQPAVVVAAPPSLPAAPSASASPDPPPPAPARVDDTPSPTVTAEATAVPAEPARVVAPARRASSNTPEPEVRATAPEPSPVREAAEAPPPEPSPDDAHLESLQVAQAERLLSSDPARALAAARSAAARFPAGFLKEERAYVEVTALARLGKKDEARAAGERFLRAYPHGAFSARVRGAIAP